MGPSGTLSAFKTEVNAELTTGCGEGERKYSCVVPELTLDASQDKAGKPDARLGTLLPTARAAANGVRRSLQTFSSRR